MKREKKPLYRKVNTRARGVWHDFGGDFRHLRHKKKATPEQVKGSMHGEKKRGLDYTPLFRFLLSKIGEDWDGVLSEAASRLDKLEPIYWVVALNDDQKKAYVRVGESSYFSGMYVDEEGILQLTHPASAEPRRSGSLLRLLHPYTEWNCSWELKANSDR